MRLGCMGRVCVTEQEQIWKKLIKRLLNVENKCGNNIATS